MEFFYEGIIPPPLGRIRPDVAPPRLCPVFILQDRSLIARQSELLIGCIFILNCITSSHSTIHFEKFFYPLDRIADWNRFYGERGFLQYQFLVPYERRESVTEILDLIAMSREVCSLTVLKVFGAIQSPGLLSFPRPGVTLALDFPFLGESTLILCEQFDQVVQKHGGAVYPAKDARMSSKSFETYFPRWREFSNFVDPCFESDFWRRVATPRPLSQ